MDGYLKIAFRKGDKFVALRLWLTWGTKTGAEVATFRRRAGKFGKDPGPQIDKGNHKQLASHAEARALLSQEVETLLAAGYVAQLLPNRLEELELDLLVAAGGSL